MTILQTVGCLVLVGLVMAGVVAWRLRREDQEDEVEFDEPGGGFG